VSLAKFFKWRVIGSDKEATVQEKVERDLRECRKRGLGNGMKELPSTLDILRILSSLDRTWMYEQLFGPCCSSTDDLLFMLTSTPPQP